MTVGEMVATAAGRMPKPNITLRSIMDAAPFFRALGIWDAEVLECEYYDGDIDEYPTLMEPGNGCIDWPGIWHLEDGQRVRVIVLPKEGE